MKSHKFKYKEILSSWGISIEIEGSCQEHRKDDDHIKVTNGLWLSNKVNRLTHQEIHYLKKGLEIVSKEIISHSPYGKNTLIVINNILFNYCDFQPDGLIPAIISWSADYFGFPTIKVETIFDKAKNEYVFLWPPDYLNIINAR